MIIVDGQYIHNTRSIEQWGYYNLSHCMWTAKNLRQVWGKRQDAEVINIGCPYQETPTE